MQREKLKDKIREIVLRIMKGETITRSKFEIVNRFPEMLPVLTDLMTTDYELFIEDVAWVAPRPSTFKVLLKNKQFFFLEYSDKSWIAQVEGKKYYLGNLPEAERASQSVSRMLKYSPIGVTEDDLEDKPSKSSSSSSGGGGSSNSGGGSNEDFGDLGGEEESIEEFVDLDVDNNETETV